MGRGELSSILLGRRGSIFSAGRVADASLAGVDRVDGVTKVLRLFAAGSRKLRVDARRFSAIEKVLSFFVHLYWMDQSASRELHEVGLCLGMREDLHQYF